MFFDTDVFAESHDIDGKSTDCTIDTDVSQALTPSTDRREGTYTAKIILFVRANDLPGEPVYDQIMTVDGVQYRAINVNLFGGMWEITLEAIS